MSDENARVLAHAEMQGGADEAAQIASRPHAEFAGVAECAEERQLSLVWQDRSERLNGSAWRHHRRACASA